MAKFLGIGLLALSACQYSERGATCAVGVGIKTQAYNGANLASNQLVLTFDGGPSDAQAAIGDYLFASDVQGTFFVDGANISSSDHAATLVGLKSHAHLVGNGGYTQTSLAQSHDPEREVRKTDQLILPYVTGDMFLLRSKGDVTVDTATRLNAAGLSRYVGPIGWDVGARSSALVQDDDCWKQNLGVADCANGYLTAIRAQTSGIVRMHADDQRTANMLRLILPQLKVEKFTFLRLDAVPAVQDALLQSGGKPGTQGGAPGCNEY